MSRRARAPADPLLSGEQNLRTCREKEARAPETMACTRLPGVGCPGRLLRWHAANTSTATQDEHERQERIGAISTSGENDISTQHGHTSRRMSTRNVAQTNSVGSCIARRLRY